MQHTCGCVIGRDYPQPICDPEAAAEISAAWTLLPLRPDEWKCLIPSAAAVEVAKERGVSMRSRAGAVGAFVPQSKPRATTAELERHGLNMSQRRQCQSTESFISPLRLRPKAVRQPVATLVVALQPWPGPRPTHIQSPATLIVCGRMHSPLMYIHRSQEPL